MPCTGGHDPASAAVAPNLLLRTLDCRRMTDNEMVKRLAWAGLVAGTGALASIVTTRIAAVIYRRLFGEDPPE